MFYCIWPYWVIDRLKTKCQSVYDATVLLAGRSDGVSDGQPSAGDEHSGAEHDDTTGDSSPEDDEDAGQLWIYVVAFFVLTIFWFFVFISFFSVFTYTFDS